MENNQNLTGHEKKMLKKQENQSSENKKDKKEIKKKTIKHAVIILVLALIIFGLYKSISNVKSFEPYYDKEFHWHANINIFTCGNEIQLKCKSGFCGTMLNHHHNDQIIHMEGSVLPRKEDISLGSFFDTINIKFSETEIADKKNGDLCNGKPGKVNLYVNGELNKEFKDYIPSMCNAQEPAEIRQRCDKIEVKFE
ncbi:hypothetical protein J4440_00960 [Candidatus Woesearchaeota archaeon]|nr:hypothetical protein [Candidatus Woesearchaeota archaeon]